MRQGIVCFVAYLCISKSPCALRGVALSSIISLRLYNVLKRSLTIVDATLLLLLIVMQARSLFVFPVPDSIRWFGDESWLMTESIATVETGTVHHPHALSSTLVRMYPAHTVIVTLFRMKEDERPQVTVTRIDPRDPAKQ